ncbi:MAG: tetratricopeptide repeat protein [Acidobacteria bacterium]|nr:MAG: tetratricopeptide repeat protein [Acidobacteriota bacterium]
MNTRCQVGLLLVLVLIDSVYISAKWLRRNGHAKQEASATISVVSGKDRCKVDLDGEGAGATGSDGILVVKSVEPGDHYVHVLCPDQRETSYFISPPPGQRMEVDARSAAASSGVAESVSINPAASEMQLRNIVSEADQLRSSGQFKESVELLRKATLLDPKNGDLHRELGITFLMFHDWERARVEMLEAVRRDPQNVEAHSGLAYALEKLGDLDGALKEYRTCTQMDPHDTSYRDHYVEVLGMLYSEKGEKKR